jgi:hypothetical protein
MNDHRYYDKMETIVWFEAIPVSRTRICRLNLKTGTGDIVDVFTQHDMSLEGMNARTHGSSETVQ